MIVAQPFRAAARPLAGLKGLRYERPRVFLKPALKGSAPLVGYRSFESAGYPRPMNGIFVAITVMNCTFASSGRLAM